MDLYFKLLGMPVFTMKDVEGLYGNIHTARSGVKRLIDKGMVMKIRNNLYTCKSGETLEPVANPYRIATEIAKDSFVSHYSALEYYGYANKKIDEMYVGSGVNFKNFTFHGKEYVRIKPRISAGVVMDGNVRITNRERTLLDSIKDMDRVAGVEEVMRSVVKMKGIREDRLVGYLDLYDNQFLYQKTGYILSASHNTLGLSDAFYAMCAEKAGKSTRYLSNANKDGRFVARWSLVVPRNLFA